MDSYAVEFVGGPLDGHVHGFTHSPEMLAWITGIPVSPGFVRSLGKRPRASKSTPTSIAVYQLQSDDELRYYHLCSVAEQECECEGT